MIEKTGLPERFWAKVDARDGEDGCWIWMACTYRGYGRFGVVTEDGRPFPRHTHRLAYVDQVGPIPEGLELDHLCRVHACCNPRHLEPVTHAENARRSRAWRSDGSRATHCPTGHRYAGANLIVDDVGAWICRKCRDRKPRHRNGMLCANGHLLIGDNLRQWKNMGTRRTCAECHRDRNREYQRRLRAAERVEKSRTLIEPLIVQGLYDG